MPAAAAAGSSGGGVSGRVTGAWSEQEVDALVSGLESFRDNVVCERYRELLASRGWKPTTDKWRNLVKAAGKGFVEQRRTVLPPALQNRVCALAGVPSVPTAAQLRVMDRRQWRGQGQILEEEAQEQMLQEEGRQEQGLAEGEWQEQGQEEEQLQVQEGLENAEEDEMEVGINGGHLGARPQAAGAAAARPQALAVAGLNVAQRSHGLLPHTGGVSIQSAAATSSDGSAGAAGTGRTGRWSLEDMECLVQALQTQDPPYHSAKVCRAVCGMFPQLDAKGVKAVSTKWRNLEMQAKQGFRDQRVVKLDLPLKRSICELAGEVYDLTAEEREQEQRLEQGQAGQGQEQGGGQWEGQEQGEGQGERLGQEQEQGEGGGAGARGGAGAGGGARTGGGAGRAGQR